MLHFAGGGGRGWWWWWCFLQRQGKIQDTVSRMREKVKAMGSRLEEQVQVLRKTNSSSEEVDSNKGHRLEDTFVKQQRRVHGCVSFSNVEILALL